MLAARLREPSAPLSVEEMPVPEPGAGQLLIRVERCGICGSDLHMTDARSCFNPRDGAVIGHEFSGEIVALGEGAVGWREGQRVTALPYVGCGRCDACRADDPVWCPEVLSLASGKLSGGFAQHVVVAASEALALPDQFSWEEGALVEPVAVALHAIDAAGLSAGDDVLVIGAGPVGLAVAAAARASGAGTVAVAARSDRRGDLARTMGATEFLIADERLGEAFARLAGGPPRIIFECVGKPGMIELCAGLAAPRSTVVMLGACMEPERFQPIVATMKELRLQFVVCYARRDFAAARDMIVDGRIDPLPMVTEVVDFAAFPVMFEALRGGTDQCKVMLAPNRPPASAR